MIKNLVNTLATCQKDIQEQMIENFTKADPDYGKRVADGLKAFKQEQPSGPIGSTGAAQAVDEAINNSTPSDPY